MSKADRDYFKKKDYGIKLQNYINKFSFLDKIIEYSLNLIWRTIRRCLTKRGTDTILIINLNRLGDTVFSLFAIDNIINKYNGYKIIILTYEDNKSILKNKYPDCFYETIDKSDLLWGRRIVKNKVRKKINSIDASIIFDLTGSMLTASFLFWNRAKKIYGKNIKYFKDIYTDFTLPREEPHFIDIYLDVVKLDIKMNDILSNREFPSKFTRDQKILIHPFAIRNAKEWSFDNYIKLAIDLKENYNTVIVSPPDFISKTYLKYIDEKGIELKITNNIDELLSIIKDSSLFISNDSGPIYIASMMGKATFTIYGPTNPKFSLPYGENHNYIQKTLKCSADSKLYCDTIAGIYCKTHECLKTLEYTDVYSAIKNHITKLELIQKNSNLLS